ncbi:uncharacterized protein [Paramormyrops kingsleyae]|uniref:Homeotic protein spalt-major-like n=1 Tax=Paramormyrops kingsleyae TaxID=1676925 RepID=A0A3B3RPG5_9TELE|nr:homeotic protein spalt-major-like [Paramormyrops kingsleyae]
MDSSVSFLKYELAATIEQAVRCAVEAVLREAARVVGAKLSAAHSAAAESHRENQSLRERLEISESELKAVRYYMSAAEKNIKQCLLLNQNQPVTDVVNQRPDDTQFLLPHTDALTSPLGRGASRGPLRSFRASSGRPQFSSKSFPSVGLCVPTVQSDLARGGVNRRRVRCVSSASLPHSQHRRAVHAPELQTEHMLVTADSADSHIYITDEGVADKEYSGRLTEDDPGKVHQGLEAASLQQEEPEMAKFEFEVGAAAGDVNELGLIRVLEDGEELKEGTVKIEDDAEGPITEPLISEPVVPPQLTQSPPVVSGGIVGIGFPPISLDGPELAVAPLPPGDSADKVHRCNVCGRGFRRFYCLKTHQRIHTGERPYPCRYCEKRFRHLDSLHKHQRIHTGERPYRCAQCGCCFRELGQLKKHRLTHAGAPPAPPHPGPALLGPGTPFGWSHVGSQSLDSN